jgi:DNA-binding transcriptional MerR regulator
VILIKSVKEISVFTGVSIRTLHYYDEIDLLKPTHVSLSGYRQYSNADIFKLQRILLLKEVGFSLTEIKKIMKYKDPRMQKIILENQLEVLILKKKKIEDLIELITLLLKGENVMLFEKFNDDEVKRTFKAMIEKLDENEISEYVKDNGGTMESAQQNFVESFDNYEGDLKYYLGDKDMEQVIKESPSPDRIEKSRKVLSALYKKLGKMVSSPINDAVLEIINKIYLETIGMFPIEKKDELFQEMAELYARNKDAAEAFDVLYGQGTANYYYKCVKVFFDKVV